MTTAEHSINPNIESSWKDLLFDNFNSESFFSLKNFLTEELKNHSIYPPGNQIFSTFNHTPYEKVKVVIIGQDPYHGSGQAHGMSFSVPTGIKAPPSLVNIFKELHEDVGMLKPNHGNLEQWCKQGVFLLNASLTVRAGQAGSHQGKGWEEFTDAVISKLSENRNHLVFLLWGKFAQAKNFLIDENKHCVLKAAHPSPFSAYNGFFGCRHFSKTNEYLVLHNKEPINWDLSTNN